MATRWYQSRTNQAAAIGGVFVLAAALVAAFVSRTQTRYPPVEIKSLTSGGEEILARLALRPGTQVVDSAAFASVRGRDVVWSESLGVAIAKPGDFKWGAGWFEHPGEIALDDYSFIRMWLDMARRGFPDDTVKTQIRFFGVRLDQPTRVRITPESRLANVPLGHNPFRDMKYTVGFLRTIYGDEVFRLPHDTILEWRRSAIRDVDSVSTANLPTERSIYSGVFVAKIRRENLPNAHIYSWLQRSLLDDAFAYVKLSVGAPSLLVIDQDRQTLIFNEIVAIQSARVDGKDGTSVTLNRAGYILQNAEAVDLVMLQYVSSQPSEVLRELERYLSSVRIRRTD